MAVFVKLWSNRNQTQDIVIRHAEEAEANSKKEYNAAVNIQSWFRGCRIRTYLKHLHEKATEIQRLYRGYLGRKHYRKILEQNLHRMREDQYQAMAIKIQSCWRGFYVRLRVFDYKAFREYVEALKVKNQVVRDRLREVHEREERARAQQALEMNEMKLQEDARRCHYLLSTAMMDGVFKKSRRSFENQMRNTRFAPHHPVRIRQAEEAAISEQERDKCREYYVCHQHRQFRYCHCQGALTPSPSNHLLESVRDDIRRDKTGTTRLPPLVPVQGPFKDPAKVLWQKVKPLEPTVRVASDYKSVEIAREKLKAEEWRTRVIEDPFNVPHPHSWEEPYAPLIHTSHPYRGHPDPYTFRENQPQKNISPHETFTTLVSPVPLFDKFNRTY